MVSSGFGSLDQPSASLRAQGRQSQVLQEATLLGKAQAAEPPPLAAATNRDHQYHPIIHPAT